MHALAGARRVAVHRDAHRAAGLPPLEAGVAEDAVEALCLRRALDEPGARAPPSPAPRRARPRRTAAAARRSSSRLFVHEPMNTRSTRSTRAACPARAPCRRARAPRLARRTGSATVAGSGTRAVIGAAVLRTRAPGHVRRDLRRVERDLAVERRVGVGQERPPVGERAVPRVAARRERPAREVREGRLVRRHHARAGAGLDRHVAERSSALPSRARASRARRTRSRGRSPPPAPMLAMMARTRSLATTPGPSRPSTDDAQHLRLPLPDGLGRQHMLDLGRADAEASAPRAPWVAVWRVAAHDREARQRQPCSGPTTWTMPWRGSPGPSSASPHSPAFRASSSTTCPGSRAAGRGRRGRDVVVGHGHGEVGPSEAAARRRSISKAWKEPSWTRWRST